ncbi:acyl-CoA thioesterase [Streptomyces sp. NPDC021080]|uniref:acyl-CoA thioesterase n=1 Tax=Streptomyces sp. NPDC021080 TaxID=3365110 RepID=UPI0037A12166
MISPELPEDYLPPVLDTISVDPLLDMLALEEIDHNLYRGYLVFSERFALYGGQVAAQALRAASLTVPRDRLPHSLHGYFLRPGNASRPTVFQVDRDRDGGSYSARRVVALQGGEVIFSMSASFHRGNEGPDKQVADLPAIPVPEDCEGFVLPRLFSMEGRSVRDQVSQSGWPTRFWARSTAGIGNDPMLNACVLTYLSDISSGLFELEDPGDNVRSGSSLDHSVWFHRPALLDEWVLTDLRPHSIAQGRGLYTGSVFDRTGQLVATIAQEALFRPVR